MDIVKLPPGEGAPADSDCISIERAPDGDYHLTGAVLDGEESIAMVGSGSYASREEAEAEGTAWAAGHGVRQLYIASERVN